jgi:hypothetical protein
LGTTLAKSSQLVLSCNDEQNDIVQLLSKNGYQFDRYSNPLEAVKHATTGSGVLILADYYPLVTSKIEDEVFELANEKKIKLYIEYSENIKGVNKAAGTVKTVFERAIVTSDVFGAELKPLAILGMNGVVLEFEEKNPLIVLGKVAGVYKAEYGIDDVKTYPLLFEQDNMLIASTKLSGFASGRFGPKDSWETVWEYILNWLEPEIKFQLNTTLEYVTPMYSKEESLPADVLKNSIIKGVDWFYKGRFFVDPSWERFCDNLQMPGAGYGPYLDENVKGGDGSLGIIEGHGSMFYWDGKQQYRYCNRADDNGQVAFAMAITNQITGRSKDAIVASNLLDFLFYDSKVLERGGDDPKNPCFGLMGWSASEHSNHHFYGDDNARAILGSLGAVACLGVWNWDKEILETILANFRTTGENGFRGNKIIAEDLQKNGWRHYWNGDIVSPHPHFESWIWACYLWLYDKTGYEPLLEKTKKAIKLTMEAYPDNWGWTNGIQQERARMILPLAWLVRVDNTPKHREWLDLMVERLLDDQMPCGAIVEELGDAKLGMYGKSTNKDYGTREATLIFRNGDPISDMLYTSNFAIFSLHEAASVTQNPEHIEAVNKLAEFLVRIQVKSVKYDDLDGTWFRAFEFEKWDYWASNADHGWGAWGTHTGWTQSTIVSTLAMISTNQSFWELTAKSRIKSEMQQIVDQMFNE